MQKMTSRKSARALAAVTLTGLALLVSACIFTPGRFSSQLEVNANRTFTFHYLGEIVLVPMMEAAKKADQAFEAEPCLEADGVSERACSETELATQRATWERAQAKDNREAAQAAQVMLGGIDPSDPASGKALAEKLSRQAGWKRAEYKGNGTFDVEFAVTSRLDRDFTFPTLEGFPLANAFVQVTVRDDGTVRIDAPGFGPEDSSASMAGMMAGMAKSGSDGGNSASAQGTFRIITDATILANNTDEGARRVTVEGSERSVLAWPVNPRSPAAPTALIRLAD